MPDDQVSESWKAQAVAEMRETNKLKYQACPHAHDSFLCLRITIAEATGDPFWGTGLNVAQTLECISDYWPGANHMGKILMELHSELQQLNSHENATHEEKKCKAESPLEGISKSVCP